MTDHAMMEKMMRQTMIALASGVACSQTYMSSALFEAVPTAANRQSPSINYDWWSDREEPMRPVAGGRTIFLPR
jgi:hypothetical protein